MGLGRARRRAVSALRRVAVDSRRSTSAKNLSPWASSSRASNPSHRDFIGRQRIFFAASAAPNARVNVSPRGDGRLRDHRRAHRRLSRPHRQRQRDRRPPQGRRAAHDHVLRLRRAAQHPEPLRARRGAAPRLCRLTPNCSRAPSAASSRPARGRSSASMSIWCRPPAGTERRSSTIAASAPRSTTGPAPRAKTGLEAYRREKNLVSIDGLPTGLFDEV